jgi:hypothetical protein
MWAFTPMNIGSPAYSCGSCRAEIPDNAVRLKKTIAASLSTSKYPVKNTSVYQGILMSENEQNATVDTSAKVTESLIGRSAFLIETVAAGVSVRTVFMCEDQRVLEMPAVFPELSFALTQIEELKQAVIKHFAQAAQVGAQVIAAQAAQATPGSADDASVDATDKEPAI